MWVEHCCPCDGDITYGLEPPPPGGGGEKIHWRDRWKLNVPFRSTFGAPPSAEPIRSNQTEGGNQTGSTG